MHCSSACQAPLTYLYEGNQVSSEPSNDKYRTCIQSENIRRNISRVQTQQDISVVIKCLQSLYNKNEFPMTQPEDQVNSETELHNIDDEWITINCIGQTGCVLAIWMVTLLVVDVLMQEIKLDENVATRTCLFYDGHVHVNCRLFWSDIRHVVYTLNVRH